MNAGGREPVPPLRGDEPDLYREHQPRLLALLRRALGVREQTLEDACSFAWVQLIRTQPERDHMLAWLYVVARREALRVLERERRLPVLEPRGDHHVITFRAPVGEGTPERARDALRALAGLPERQRRLLALHVAGLTYNEIAAVEGISYTAVNRHLARARKLIAAGEGGEL